MSCLFDSIVNNTKYTGDIIIKRFNNDSLSINLLELIPNNITSESFINLDRFTKAKIYKAVYKELKKLQKDNNEYIEMISDKYDSEGMSIKFIIEVNDRSGYIERYNNNNKTPLFVMSREVVNNKIKGLAIYDANNIFSIERCRF